MRQSQGDEQKTEEQENPEQQRLLGLRFDLVVAAGFFLLNLVPFFVQIDEARREGSMRQHWMSTLIFGPSAVIFAIVMVLRWTECRAAASGEGFEDVMGSEMNNLGKGGTAADEDEEDEQLAAAAARGEELSTSTKVLAPATLGMLLLTVLISPAPNFFVSMLTLFYGAVLLVLTYAWFTEVLMVSERRAPWLAFFCIVNFYTLVTSQPRQRMYPACARDVKGVVGQSFNSKVEFIPWNCIDPKFTVEDGWPFRAEKKGEDWIITGKIPGLPESVIELTSEIELECAGHKPDVTPFSIWFATSPGTLDKNVTIDANGAGSEPCFDVPSFTHIPMQDLSVQLMFLGVLLLSGTWIGLHILGWLRQRGYCLCLCCRWCRKNYHGLNQKPDTAAADGDMQL